MLIAAHSAHSHHELRICPSEREGEMAGVLPLAIVAQQLSVEVDLAPT